MHRYFIKLSFDGTHYNGWQIQKNSSQTVQQKIQEGLSQLLNEKIELTGCCRTDSGVHAKELYAHFDSKKNNLHNDSATDWLYKFNKMIPQDIAIDGIYAVKKDANARFDAMARTYQYFIHQKRNPFLLKHSYYYYGELDLPLMNKAGKFLKKQEDFSAFSKVHTQAKTNKCKIFHAKWEKKSDSLTFTIRANRFLRGMVRMIAGTMMDLGKHKITLDDFKKIIESKDCRNAGALVPACGLYLTKVEYPKNIFKK
ncbi:MAG: tRNA pseudouridine(38-40) synthase TruA [Bacteroidetes bacterium]|nr:tRNA pseudouridine(38-40) synthase TruA [Bacteroidota bacterium]